MEIHRKNLRIVGMPTYCFRDTETGEVVERFMTINEMLRAERRDGTFHFDNRVFTRDIAAEHGGFANTPGNWPMKCDAAGVHPSQINATQDYLASRGIMTEYDRQTGQAIFRSREHRKRTCEALGLFDRSGGYSDPMPGARH